MNNIGLGILFYNEIENARKILDDIMRLNLSNIDFYFFDNGSKNPEFTQWLSTIQNKNIKILEVEENLGFGGGAKYLLENIPNDIRGYMPGNYKVQPSSLIDLESLVGDPRNLEVFKATRSGRSLIENLKTQAVGLVTSVYFKKNMMDSGGTPTLISGKFVEVFQNGPDDFSFEAFLLYVSREKNFRVTRAPILYGSRLFGSSHWQSGLKSEIKLLSRIMSQRNQWRKTSRLV
jgi:hypothetical protein